MFFFAFFCFHPLAQPRAPFFFFHIFVISQFSVFFVWEPFPIARKIL